MKLTNSTLKQYIRQVLKEEKQYTIDGMEFSCSEITAAYNELKNAAAGGDTSSSFLLAKYKKYYYYCKYPMKKKGVNQQGQRVEINAACFGWKSKGKANRVGGKAYRDKKCPTGKISFDQWREARKLNWRGKLHAANKVLEQSAVTQRGAEKRISGFAPGEAGAARRVSKGGLSTSQQAQELEAAQAQGMRDVWMVREKAGLCKRAAPKFECAGPALEDIVKLKVTAQNLHDEMKGAGSGDAVKIMIANQKNLAGLWAAYELVTTPWEKKKWGDLAQWLSDEAGCELCKRWAPKVRAAISGKGGSAYQEKESFRRGKEWSQKYMKGDKGQTKNESKVFSSFPEQQKLTEGWKKYLDTE